MVKSSPPAHLSASSRRLFRGIANDFALWKEPAALATLQLAAEALDRVTEARVLIEEHGILVPNRFGELRPNPALTLEKDARIAVLRALRELSLDPVEVLDTRPPRLRTGALA